MAGEQAGEGAQQDTLHDIYVVSDLHLGRGRNPRTRRFFALETFLYDHDFYFFCEHLCEKAEERKRPFTLIINGDGFDFLRIQESEFPHNHRPTRREKRYGACLTPDIAAGMMRKVVEGHPRFMKALAMVLDAGHKIFVLPGNHDLEIQWESVRDELRKGVAAQLEDAARAEDLRFHDWFYYEEGRIWVEHGCQYDQENAFNYNLRKPLEGSAPNIFQAEQDQPLGNFFQRYLYNRFGAMTFMVPSTSANGRYVRWLLSNKPSFFMRVLYQNVPFAVQIVRKMGNSRFGKKVKAMMAEAHTRRLNQIAESSGLGDKLLQIDALKETKGDVVTAAEVFIRGLIRNLMTVGVGGVAWIFAFVTGVRVINDSFLGTLASSVMLAAYTSFMLFLVLLGVLYMLTREPREIDKEDLQQAAATKTAALLGVPIVTYGHTHEEVVDPLNAEGSAWMFNTGTWVATYTPHLFVPRERLQFSVLQVRGNEGELLQWKPDTRALVPVHLIDEA